MTILLVGTLFGSILSTDFTRCDTCKYHWPEMSISCLLLLTVVVLFVTYNFVTSKKNDRLPPGTKKLPGPRGLPVLGSVHEVPEKNSFLKFHQWGEKYGPIYQVNLAGTNHIWISRDDIAKDLLSKRSAIYSDRPHIPALRQDNRTSSQYLPLMSTTDIWTRQRRFAKQIMDISAKASFYDYPELESVRLLFELMAEPSKYNIALESYVARVTCRLAWGTAVPADELKQRARELLIGVSPTGSLANKLAFLMKIPAYLSPVRAWENRRSRTEEKFFEMMQNEVQTQIDSASGPQSWMRQFLNKKSSWGFASDVEGAFAVGMHGIAGALTIAAPMQGFCLAICHHPQFQSILHEEVDRVCGDRMPRFSDMPNMPVLRAFIRETMRWRPPVPTGIPHELVKDDIYNGFHIPAGSVIHPLEYSIGRDPKVFHDPEAFNPLRWLEANYPTYREPLSQYPTITSYSQFGYGKRTCLGMGVTDADLFVGIGSIAWLFTISHGPAPETTAAVSLSESHSSITLPSAKATIATRGSSRSPCTPPENSDVGLSFRAPEWDGAVLSGKLDDVNKHAFRGPGSYLRAPFQNSPLTPPDSPERRLSVDDLEGVDSACPPILEERPIAKVAKTVDGGQSDKTQDDPTLNYSSLLIAKPLPFKFELKIRNQGRAESVAKEWLHKKMTMEFEESKCYWKGGNAGDKQYGWGRT